jgi:hypothetical protein
MTLPLDFGGAKITCSYASSPCLNSDKSSFLGLSKVILNSRAVPAISIHADLMIVLQTYSQDVSIIVHSHPSVPRPPSPPVFGRRLRSLRTRCSKGNSIGANITKRRAAYWRVRWLCDCEMSRASDRPCAVVRIKDRCMPSP